MKMKSYRCIWHPPPRDWDFHGFVREVVFFFGLSRFFNKSAPPFKNDAKYGAWQMQKHGQNNA